jgi:hypothetical protein
MFGVLEHLAARLSIKPNRVSTRHFRLFQTQFQPVKKINALFPVIEIVPFHERYINSLDLHGKKQSGHL